MIIGIFTDIHANLPALEKSIEFFKKQHCDAVVHLGDLIGMGPYPRECAELALAQKNMSFIMGNHDEWYAHGIKKVPNYMKSGEYKHHQWVHKQLGKNLKKEFQKWPWFLKIHLEGNFKIDCRHYGLTTNDHKKNKLKGFLKKHEAKQLDKLFDNVDANLVLYGHTHQSTDESGVKRYINPGSAGCYNKAEAKLLIIKSGDGRIKLEKHRVKYDDGKMMEEFEIRKVPDRDLIKKVFIIR